MSLLKHYDVVIIGGGIGGLMCAYRLSEKRPDLKVLILERGKDLENRKCPILTGAVTKCVKCKTCAIMEGMAGAGAFSDGKYNITTEYGGWLPLVMNEKKVMDYILQADAILMEHGAQKEVYEPDNELKTLCLQHDLHMQQGRVKHLGTDANYHTMLRLIDTLKESRSKPRQLSRMSIKRILKSSIQKTEVNRESAGKKSSSPSAVSATACLKNGAMITASNATTTRWTSASESSFPMKSGNISPQESMNPRSSTDPPITATGSGCSVSMKEAMSSPKTATAF